MKRKRHTWTPAEEAIVRDGFGQRPTRDIAAEIGVTPTAVRQRAGKLGVRVPVIWTPGRIDTLRSLYETLTAQECADAMGVSLCAVSYAASKHGLRKPKAWIAERARMLITKADHPARQTRFQKGITPHNKGKPHPTRGRAAETQFKPGQKPHGCNPLGHERLSKDGYLQRKLTDTGVTRRDYVPVHHIIWREAGHDIPPGHALVFRDGNKQNIVLENLELVSRAQLMRRNSYHNYGPEIARLVQMRGAITRQINKREKQNEHQRPA